MHSLVKIYRPDSKGKLQYIKTIDPFDEAYIEAAMAAKVKHRNYPNKYKKTSAPFIYKKRGGGKRGVG